MTRGEKRWKEVQGFEKEAKDAQRPNDLAKVHRKLERMFQEERRYERS